MAEGQTRATFEQEKDVSETTVTAQTDVNGEKKDEIESTVSTKIKNLKNNKKLAKATMKKGKCVMLIYSYVKQDKTKNINIIISMHEIKQQNKRYSPVKTISCLLFSFLALAHRICEDFPNIICIFTTYFKNFI